MKPRSAGLPQLRRLALVIAIRVLGVLLLSASLAPRVEAQRAGTIRLGLTLERDSLAVQGARKHSAPLARDTTSSRGSRTVRGALIGAGVGVATGLVVAAISTHDESITDSSMDGLAYIYYTAVFGLGGLVVGGIVGFARK
jgi:hypothetical protein